MTRGSLIVVIVVTSIAVVAVLGWRLISSEDSPDFRTVRAERQDLVQDVTFTGVLETYKLSQLGFEVTGTVQDVLVEVGDKVDEGDILVQLDPESAQLGLAKARADRASGQEAARLAWEKAKSEADKLKLTNAATLDKRRQTVRDAKAERDQAKEVWLATERENGDNSTTEAAYRTLLAAESTYHATQEALKETLSSTAETAAKAEDAAAIAQANYQATLQASVSSAGLSSLEATEEIKRLAVIKSDLKAPFSGTVTAVEVTRGDVITSGATLVKVATLDLLEIVAKVPEIDAVKLTPDQAATVTFDALTTTSQWSATVTEVAPAAEIIDGIPTYETTLILHGELDQLKPGLTANITVHAAEASDVIAVPRRAVITQEERQFVKIVEPDDSIREVTVETGLVGSNGRIEITSGLLGGERVITSSTASRAN